MDNKKLNEIKERAKKILGNINIETSVEDIEIIKELDRIANLEKMEIEREEKVVNQIEVYFLVKEKMKKVEENYNYLSSISKELKKQRVRKDDKIKGFPIFKIIDGERKYYFLTREKAQEFIKLNRKENTEILQIEENENEKLENLIKAIKEDF